MFARRLLAADGAGGLGLGQFVSLSRRERQPYGVARLERAGGSGGMRNAAFVELIFW